jgi:Ser/Thr protein kinase RdoA (MazF antagonist)
MSSARPENEPDVLALVTRSLPLWRETEGGTPRFINHSENLTFLVAGPGDARHVLRLHRPHYHSRTSIASELAWLEALEPGPVPVPRLVRAIDGTSIQEVASDRYAAVFAFEAGQEPKPEDDLVALFSTLGRYAAELHLHVGRWEQPERFVRPIWDGIGLLEPAGLWGDWRKAPGVEGEIRTTLLALDQRLRQELAAYGTDIDRFGLIHADMRLANLLVDGDRVTLLDFDDCGFGWFMYDLAASLSFFETSPQVPALIRAWLQAYMQVRPLKADDIRMIDTMILFRRMALLAWIGSHEETALAKAHADRFATDTAEMARRYLAR